MEQKRISDNAHIYNGIESGYETVAQRNKDGAYELSVLVSGVHCAGCIQKIESALSQEKNIQNARLNFSTGRLSITWLSDASCANDYVRMVEDLGYSVQPYAPEIEREESAKQERFLLLCLGVSGFAMGNIMLLSVGVWATSSEIMGGATRDLMHWVSGIIALPTILFSGRPFFRSALKALAKGHTNMDVPISLALILAGGMSLFETMQHGEHVYFDSAVMLIFFLLIGRYLDFRARKNARSTATNLLSTLSGFANVVEGEKTKRVLIRDLKEGMIVRVAAGEKFPVDGMIMNGVSEVDTSLVTGETMPRAIKNGDEIFAGTMNLSNPVVVQVAKAAENSLLADIVRLMEKAGQGQSQYVRLADRAAQFYTPIVHACAAMAFLGWWLVGGMVWQDALMIAVTVLIITCPCALGLAVPIVQVLASARLTTKGILVKSGDALERLARIDTALLDKTGTLTLGHPVLDDGYDPDALAMAASLAVQSAHPLSKALVSAYQGPVFEITDIKEHPGQGLESRFEGKKIRLGSRAWCGDENTEASNKLELWLSIEGQKSVPFYFTDHLRVDTKETIENFRISGVNPIMLSGDRYVVAHDVALRSGIDQVYAEKSPTQKYEILENLKNENHNVLMVGDGLNDAPTLAGADVSIAPGTAIDMAQNAADIVFMGEKLSPVYDAYKTACLTQMLVKQNFALAIAYNIIAVPLALAGLVTPLVAAIAMSGSSLLVIANSFRLRFHI